MNTVRILAAALALSAVTGSAFAGNVRYADQSAQRTVANSLITEVRTAKPAESAPAARIRYADQSDARTVANSIVEYDGKPSAARSEMPVQYSDYSQMRSFAN